MEGNPKVLSGLLENWGIAALRSFAHWREHPASLWILGTRAEKGLGFKEG